MDTTAQPGIYSAKDVKVIGRDDILNHDIANALMLMIYDYVKAARDISTTEEQTWTLIRDSVLQGDLGAILICHFMGGKPQGFMYCRMDEGEPSVAIIHCAYSKSHTPKEAVSRSLAIFEDWARFQKAKSSVFYTFRVPGAHKLMLERGWRHMITSYKKEL